MQSGFSPLKAYYGKKDADSNPYAFGLGKRAAAYTFGLGRKRDPYAFGLGKRDPYAFGLGKRDPYAFGLGKRDPYAFGLGKTKKLCSNRNSPISATTMLIVDGTTLNHIQPY